MIQGRERDIKHSFKCLVCSDTGWMLIKDKAPEFYGEGKMVEYARKCPKCNGGHMIRVAFAQSESDIPQIYSDKGMESFRWDVYKDSSGKTMDMKTIKDAVTKFIDNFDQWEKERIGLYIWSNIKGTGKTFLASCISNELMKRKAIGTKFVSAANLLDIAKSGNKNSSDPYERDPIELLCKCKLLVLDDLGQNALPIGSAAENYFSNVIFRIVDERYKNGLLTIITSNTDQDTLPLRDAATDRITAVTVQIPLPNCCIRSADANARKYAFLKKQGVI